MKTKKKEKMIEMCESNLPCFTAPFVSARDFAVWRTFTLNNFFDAYLDMIIVGIPAKTCDDFLQFDDDRAFVGTILFCNWVFLRLKKLSLESNYCKICPLICRILDCRLIIYIFVCSIIASFHVLGISISYFINHISYSFNIFYTHIIAQYMSFLSRLFLLG